MGTLVHLSELLRLAHSLSVPIETLHYFRRRVTGVEDELSAREERSAAARRAAVGGWALSVFVDAASFASDGSMLP